MQNVLKTTGQVSLYFTKLAPAGSANRQTYPKSADRVEGWRQEEQKGGKKTGQKTTKKTYWKGIGAYKTAKCFNV